MYGKAEYIDDYHNNLSDFEVYVMKRFILSLILLILIIGGCTSMKDSNQPNDSKSTNGNTQDKNENMIQTIMLPFKNIQVRDIL